MTKKNSPDFLGIGAQKSATRWLYNQLKRHDDIYLTPIKELHYFDKIRKAEMYSDRYDLDVWKKNFYNLKLLAKVDWKVKYFFGKYSDEWYSSLFNGARGRKSGEITPEYSILGVDEIKQVKSINPEMKMIYLLRNPASRAWSHFRMHVRRSGLKYDRMDEKEVFKFIGSINCYRKGNYLENLKKWYSVFEEEKVFIGYLEEVIQRPDELLQNVLKHIGVDTDLSHLGTSIEEASHVGQHIPIEPKYQDFLQEKYFQHNKDLYELLGNEIIKTWNN